MNIVVLSGRLTKKPELRSTASGMMVCQFSLAVHNGKVDDEGNRGVDFIECVCFGKQAENLAKYQDKGGMVELKGKIQVDKYTNKEGKNTLRTLIYADMINYIGKAQTSSNEVKNEQIQGVSNNPFEEMGNRVANDNENQLPF